MMQAHRENRLTPERFSRLSKLKYFRFEGRDDIYVDKIREIKSFVLEEGRLPYRNIKSEVKFNRTLEVARMRFEKLDPEKQALLKEIPGFSIENKTDIIFRENLSLTEKVIRKNKCLPRNNATDPLEIKAYNFLNNVRQRKKQGIMSQHRIKTIDKAIPGFSWEPLLDKKDKPMDALLVFMRENQRLPSVRSSNPKEITLANLMYMIRQRKKRGELTSDQISQLNKFPFWLWSRKDRS
jgi:hypothetical protein